VQNNLNLHRTLLGIAAVIIILAGVKLAAEIVVPFLLSLFIAIICSPMIKAMTQRRIPHWLAITLLFVLISLVFFFLVGLINSTAREFTQSIPQYKVLLSQRVSDLTGLLQRFNLPFTLSRETIQENFDPSIIMNFVSRVLLNFSGVVSNVFVLVLVVIFMLSEAPTMKHKFAMVMSSTPHDAAKEERHLPSRFIAELPRECIQEIRLRGTVTRAMNLAKVGSLSNTSAVENEWKMGQKVKHEKFGFGTVINVEGSDNNTRLQIAFQAQGIKWLIAHLAKLEKVR